MTNDELYAKEVSVITNAIAYAIETYGLDEPPDELVVDEESTAKYIAAAMRVVEQGAVIPALRMKQSVENYADDTDPRGKHG